MVFSDLHVNPKTLQPCLDVLRRVHEEARSRQAGVLFLGAFFWGGVLLQRQSGRNSSCMHVSDTRHARKHRGVGQQLHAA